MLTAKIIASDTHVIWTPLWGSALHHRPCPWSEEVSSTPIVQTMDRGNKGRLERGRNKCSGNCTATLQFPKVSLLRGEAEISLWAVSSSHLHKCCLQEMGKDFSCFLLLRSTGGPQNMSQWALLLRDKVCHPRSWGPGATDPVLHSSRPRLLRSAQAQWQACCIRLAKSKQMSSTFPIWHL